MAPKEPTRAQLSSRLSYQQKTPAFLLKFQNRIAGIKDEEDEDEDEEFEYVGNGREPIPRRPRPAIPERPSGDPGSDDEDDRDEKPQVVVLKVGKHLTEREAENIRRKEKGLPPLPDPEAQTSKTGPEPSKSSKPGESGASKSAMQGLSFSSSSKGSMNKKTTGKRKAVGQLDEEKDNDSKQGSKSTGKKKAKKTSKALLSFGDEA